MKMTGKQCRSGGNCWCKKDLGSRFKHYQPLLEEIIAASPARRASLLKKAPSCVIRLLSECGLNVLKGNVKLTDGQYKSLKPHRRLLLQVSEPSLSLKERREVLAKKKGGFLPVILPILLSALSGFAGQAVAKAVGIS